MQILDRKTPPKWFTLFRLLPRGMYYVREKDIKRQKEERRRKRAKKGPLNPIDRWKEELIARRNERKTWEIMKDRYMNDCGGRKAERQGGREAGIYYCQRQNLR